MVHDKERKSKRKGERGREKRVVRVRPRIYRKKLVSREYEIPLGLA